MAVQAQATGTSGGPPTTKISDVISTYRPTTKFRSESPDSYITSLDFDDTGELLVAACSDETIQLYNCKEGKLSKALPSKKYGAHLARFTHSSSCVLYASTKMDDTIRYLSTHDNQFLRYFKGHTAPVTCLAISPGGDEFLSGSLDNTVLLWSLSSAHAHGKLLLHSPYLAAFDPTASVVAIASPSTSTLLLYDLRNYDKAPFATFDLLELEQRFTPKSVGRDWTKVEFSNDGKSILIATNSAGHFLLDAFNGNLRAFCYRKHNASPPRAAPGRQDGVLGQGDVCFTPDGRFIVGGTHEDNMYVWDTQKEPSQDLVLKPEHELEFKGSRGAVVAFNPRHNIFASADKEVVFWLPDPHAVD
ncbi:MAG: member of Set1p complex, histone methyl transferase [Geoglossum umbratile]|nr:MAG: member of Set1p complex, histone methyl transferase [Geoglossum umbratile]